MQCIATTRTGARCRREAEADSETCFSHQAKSASEPPAPKRPPDFYAAGVPKALRKAHSRAAQLQGLDREATVLRTFILEAAAAGNANQVRLLIAELARVLKTQKDMGDSADVLGAWIDAALDILDADSPLA